AWRRPWMSLPPPDGLRLRPATVADAPAIDELITAADEAVQGWSESSQSELLGWWRMVDLERDSWVLHDDHSIAAYAVRFAPGDAFADEWNFVHTPFDKWWQLRVAAPDFDPTLWFIVRDGDELAAVARCEPERSNAGFVGLIGVRKPWRRRGIGLALLRHIFGEFYRRGQPRIALGVDADNPTGATRLYERAGMRVAFEAVTYGKERT